MKTLLLLLLIPFIPAPGYPIKKVCVGAPKDIMCYCINPYNKHSVAVWITVAHAGVKSEGMGWQCKFGYKIDPNKPERIVAITKELLRLFKPHSHIYLKCPSNPIIDGWWRVEDQSCMGSKGVEIYVCNPIVVTFGGCWRGKILF